MIAYFSTLLLALAVVSFPPPPPSSLTDTMPTTAAKRAESAKFTQNLGATVPLDAHFRDEAGRLTQLGTFLGQRPAILVMGYHECPMLCSLVLSGLVESLTEIRATTGRDFDLIDVSINPLDSSEQADKQRRIYFRRYLRAGGENGWHFLTSVDELPIHRLADAVGFHYAYDSASKQYAHPSGLVILTPDGKVSQYFFGVTFDAGQLQSALSEARGQHIGARIQELLLVCFHYSPIRGRYGAIIMMTLRIAAVVTALMLGVYITYQVRRERASSIPSIKT